MSTAEGGSPSAVNALHSVTRAYRALRKWQSSRHKQTAAAVVASCSSESHSGSNGNAPNIRQQQMLQQLSTVKRIAKDRTSTRSRPCSAAAKQMPPRRSDSKTATPALDRPQTPQLVADKLQLLKSPKSNSKSTDKAEVFRGRSQSVSTPVVPPVNPVTTFKRSSVELPRPPIRQQQHDPSIPVPSATVALTSPTRSHTRPPSVVLPSIVNQSAPVTSIASQPTPVLTPVRERRPSAIARGFKVSTPTSYEQTPSSSSTPVAALSPPASKSHHRGQPSYSQAISMAIDAVSPKNRRSTSKHDVPTLHFSAAAALRLLAIESMDAQIEANASPAVPRSTRKGKDADLDTPKTKLIAMQPSFAAGSTSKQLTAVLTDIANKAPPSTVPHAAVTPKESGLQSSKAKTFVLNTSNSSNDSDEENGIDASTHIEHNYMMGRRPSQQWLSWEDVIRQRKLSVSNLPQMQRKQSKSRTKPTRQRSDSSTPSSVPSTPAAASPADPAASTLR